MDGAGAGGVAPERRKQLTAAEAVNHKRPQLAQMVERELALTGADSVTDFDDALQMVLVETAFGRYPKHLLDVYTGKVVGRQERGDVVKSWQHVEKMSAPGGATGDEGHALRRCRRSACRGSAAEGWRPKPIDDPPGEDG